MRLGRLCRWKSLFPLLRLLRLRVWPISYTEASLLFSANLRFIELSLESISKPYSFIATPLSIQRQEQLCLWILITRSVMLQSFVYDISRCFPNPKLNHLSSLDLMFATKGLTNIAVCTEGAYISCRRGFQWLERASKMEHLQSFEFTPSLQPDRTIPYPCFGSFSRLENLTITGNAPLLSLIFESLETALRFIRITIDHNARPYELRTCMEALVCSVGDTLESFFLFWKAEDRPGFFSISDTLQPMKYLRSLSLIGPFSFTTDDLTSLARAWPYLELLHIISGNNIIAPEFDALIVLATLCPRLRSIRIPRARDNLPSLDTVPCLPHVLILLEIRTDHWNAGVDREFVKRVSTIVHRLFPAFPIKSDMDNPSLIWIA